MNPPADQYPPGSSPVDATVALSGGVNLRSAPDTSAANVIRAMPCGERVTVYEQPSVTYTYGSASYQMIRVDTLKGEHGWAIQYWGGEDVFVPYVPPVPPEKWTTDLKVPYVSQIDTTSALSSNDCGVACLAMLSRYKMFQDYSAIEPTLPTVDDLVRHTVLAQPNPPHGLTFAQIGELSKQLGFHATYIQPLSETQITRLLDTNTPVMVLLDYSVYNPASKPLAHILVISGYNDTDFLTQDPYILGANVAIERARLMQAMSSSPGNSVGNQALVLA